MRRLRGRSAEPKGRARNGNGNAGNSRRSKSVERPNQRKGAMSYDDDEYDAPNRHNSKDSSYSNDFVSGDDDDKKGSGYFWGGSSPSKKSSSTHREERTRELDDMNKANEMAYSHTLAAVNDIEKLSQKKGANPLDERFKVMPDAEYPNTYLNREELRQEMNRKSFFFHDLRVKERRGNETGQLRLEILQCFGLPTTSLMRECAPYCVAVCGGHAFKTDVMPQVANPMWLCRMRRACLIPINEAYARLYLGVFDNNSTSESSTTDFIGRVVLDIARLRPMCTYDFTVPLRQSGHVFSRVQQGAIRVRLHLVWASERQAIMTYLPTAKPKFQPNESVSVACLDDISFRNVAHTVHGTHMPGKFSMTLLKATIREINFTRIHVFRYMRKREVWNLVYWQYPLISGFVFVAWMHSVWACTVRYVPGHILAFFLLHLYKNYAHYGMDSVLNQGFMAPTMEELMNAVLYGTRKRRFLEPLNMEMDQSHAINPMEHLDAADDYEEANTDAVPLSEIAESMRKSIRVQSHKYRLKTYKNCFLGNEGVDFLVQFGYAHSRPEAVMLGRKLARETRLFEHVARKHDFEDRDYFYHFLEYDTKRYIIKGHTARGRWILNLLGLAKEQDSLMSTRGHVEFPFATGEDHPRFTVQEALVIRSAEAKKIMKEKESQQDIADCAEFGVLPPPINEPGKQLTNAAGQVANVAGDVLNAGVGVVRAGVRRASLLGGMNTNANVNKDSDNESEPKETPERRRPPLSSSLQTHGDTLGYGEEDDIYDKLKSRNNPTLDELLEAQQNANAYDKFAYDSDDDVVDMMRKRNKGFIIEEKILKKPPNQDLAVKTGGGDKSFAKTMGEARHKAHGLLLHLFNDRAYTVDQTLFPTTIAEDPTERESVKSAKSKKKRNKMMSRLSGAHKVKEEEEDKKKKKRMVTPYDARVDELEKLLSVNKYSHPNPWINRVGVIVQPIVEIIQGWLFLFRALHNIFTWQDPILSFWIAFLGPIVVVISYVLPYRIVFFILGVLVVGPQNLLLRLFRESRGDPPPDFDKISKKKKPQKEEKFEDVQFFSSEAPGNQSIEYVKVDPKQIKQVVVPYAPLKYNRFYDWPPEPQYARVYASPPPRNNVAMYHDYSDEESEGERVTVDASSVKHKKKKKKKKGIKKLASQVRKGTGTVVFAGGELASRTRNTTMGVAKGTVGLTKNAVLGTAKATTHAMKGTVNVTKGAVKGTGKVAKGAVKGTARGVGGVLGGLRHRRKNDEYDDDEY